MIASGILQYMVVVQEMPTHIEMTIQKIISNFIWDKKKVSINQNHLSQKISEGGIKLLDIKARNEAIELIWLKGYLSLGKS